VNLHRRCGKKRARNCEKERGALEGKRQTCHTNCVAPQKKTPGVLLNRRRGEKRGWLRIPHFGGRNLGKNLLGYLGTVSTPGKQANPKGTKHVVLTRARNMGEWHCEKTCTWTRKVAKGKGSFRGKKKLIPGE